MKLEQGKLVTKSVRLVRLLGEGGMGSVWVGYHQALDAQVAVKFMHPDLVKRVPNIAARFRREASAAAKIKSPHVVRSFDHGETDDGTPFIVMELLEGESLSERLERTGKLMWSEIDLIVKQVARALRKAHKLGIVHRDLKPDNLFLVDSGLAQSDEDPPVDGKSQLDELFVKVLDFGIAKHTAATTESVLTQVGATVGTPEYMSPEQVLSADKLDLRADLWALSAVIYHCITGGPPFVGETLGALFQAITSGKYKPPSELADSQVPELDGWFKRAFHEDPDARFGSARELSTTFSELVGKFAWHRAGMLIR